MKRFDDALTACDQALQVRALGVRSVPSDRFVWAAAERVRTFCDIGKRDTDATANSRRFHGVHGYSTNPSYEQGGAS